MERDRAEGEVHVSGAPHRGMTSRALVKAIFEADAPESFVRTLPPQSLFMAISQNGLASSSDIVELCTVEQLRVVLDFDLWRKDTFKEEHFWEWLRLKDDSDPLRLTQKLLKSVDLKLIALLISKYVQVTVFDEATENPPSVGHYTPDKGFTWILVTLEDADRHFLFSRLLALIFETSRELFYQLVSIPSVSTESVLEEEAFQDKVRRLSGEGVPDPERTSKLNFPMDRNSFSALLAKGGVRDIVSDISVIEPLLYDRVGIPAPLSALLAEIPDREECEAELTLVMNAAILHWGIDFSEYEQVLLLTEKVRGAINIGLQRAIEISGGSIREIYRATGLAALYRAGLGDLLALRRLAKGLSEEAARAAHEDPVKFSILAHAMLPFPEAPLFLRTNGDIADQGSTLEKGSKAITTLAELASMGRVLQS